MIARLAVASLVTGLIGSAVLSAPAAHAGTRPMSACGPTEGVVVAVDFSHWGGPVVRACGSTPATGYELLNQGGFRTTGTSHDGAGFVCRIAYAGWAGGSARPSNSEEPCVRTPSASAYWSYWHADPGASAWSYSRLGAMSARPRPGSVELWTFGGTDTSGTAGSGRPRIGPDAVRATATARTHAPTTRPETARRGRGSGPTTTPDPTASRSLAGRAGTVSGRAAAPGSTGPGASATGTSPGPGGSATAAANTATPTAGVDPASLPPTVLDAVASSAVPRQAAGSPVPALIALGLVVALGSGGVLLMLRLPRAGEDR